MHQAVSSQVTGCQEPVNPDCVRIERLLPPQGIEIADADRQRWLSELDAIDKQAASPNANSSTITGKLIVS